MKVQLLRLLPWLVVLVVGICYGIAFMLPARSIGVIDGPLGEPLLGWVAFDWALTLNVDVWYANPVLWLGAVLLLLRLWRWAALAGLAALSLSLIFFLRTQFSEHRYVYYSGFWLWTGSQGLLAVSAALGAILLPSSEQTALRALRAYCRTRRGWAGLIGGLWVVLSGVILCIGLDTAAKQRQPSKQKPRWDNQEGFSYVPFFLAPLSQPDEPLPIVEDVWANLFEGMAADPETHALLRRLCAGADVQLTAQESRGPEAEKEDRQLRTDAPPDDQRRGFLELRTVVPGKRGKEPYAACLNVKLCCTMSLSMGHYLRNGDRSTALDLVRLLANDYLLRHHSGYQLIHGEVFDNQGEFNWNAVPAVEGSPAEVRRELDQEIREFIDHVQRKLKER